MSKWILDELAAAYRNRRALVLLFDYDGTLAPIAPLPRLARLSGRMRLILQRLARRPGVALGVLSGRAVGELKHMLCLDNVCLAGVSGLELELGGRRVGHRHAARAQRIIAELHRTLRRELREYDWVWIEDKGLGLTVHYRAMPDGEIGELLDRCAKLFHAFRAPIRVVEGPKSLEVVADLGWTKGTAVQLILKHLRADKARLLYAGDSANDADAMEEVVRRKGFSVGVGPDAPAAAELRLPGPEELQLLLEQLDALLPAFSQDDPQAVHNALAAYGRWMGPMPGGLF